MKVSGEHSDQLNLKRIILPLIVDCRIEHHIQVSESSVTMTERVSMTSTWRPRLNLNPVQLTLDQAAMPFWDQILTLYSKCSIRRRDGKRWNCNRRDPNLIFRLDLKCIIPFAECLQDCNDMDVAAEQTVKV